MNEESVDINNERLRLFDETHRIKQNPSKAYLDFIKSHTDKPVLIGIPVTDDSIAFYCPWCKHIHTHSSQTGKRASHCPNYQGEYYIFNISDRSK